MAKDGQGDGEFAREESVARGLEQACAEEAAVGEERVAVRVRADAQGEFNAGLLAGDIVLEVGIDGLVLEIQLARECQENDVVLERGKVEHSPLGWIVAG